MRCLIPTFPMLWPRGYWQVWCKVGSWVFFFLNKPVMDQQSKKDSPCQLWAFQWETLYFDWLIYRHKPCSLMTWCKDNNPEANFPCTFGNLIISTLATILKLPKVSNVSTLLTMFLPFFALLDTGACISLIIHQLEITATPQAWDMLLTGSVALAYVPQVCHGQLQHS